MIVQVNSTISATKYAGTPLRYPVNLQVSMLIKLVIEVSRHHTNVFEQLLYMKIPFKNSFYAKHNYVCLPC